MRKIAAVVVLVLWGACGGGGGGAKVDGAIADAAPTDAPADAGPDGALYPPLPASFLWGSATSAHQVEGGTTQNDWSVWETLSNKIVGNQHVGIADDHYNQFDADIALAASMGQNAYRFSIEWSRIEPVQGQPFVQAEVDHYKAVIASCKAHGVKPVITLLHFTLPKWVLNPAPGQTSLGGFTNHATVDAYVSFVTRIVPLLAADVDFWMTINEPQVQILFGYVQGDWPPGIQGDFTKAAQALGNMAEAHVLAYDAIHAYYATLSRPVTVTVASHYLVFDPLVTPRDDPAVASWDHFFNKSFLDAVTLGDLDTDFMGTIVHHADWTNRLDVLGVNYYRRNLVPSIMLGPLLGVPREDTAAALKGDNGWGIYPLGLTRALRDLWARYHLPMYVTENGVADAADKYRPYYIVSHVAALQQAVLEGIDVRGYFHWSLMDNWEWKQGFLQRFGLWAIDYNSPARTRSARPSAAVYSSVIRARGVTPALEVQYGPP